VRCLISDCYDKRQFRGLSLKDIPKPGMPGNPTFIFHATSLQSGRSFRFRPDHIAGWKLGESTHTDLPLALAVAASSAFPPLFSPRWRKCRRDWRRSSRMHSKSGSAGDMRWRMWR